MNSLKQLVKLDKEISKAPKVLPPKNGWITTLRKVLNMSMEQLGKRADISTQGIHAIEKREQEGTITLNKLRELANVLEMDLCYMLIPRTSLENFVEKRAQEIAQKIVMKSHQTMKLENQEVSKRALQTQTKELAEELKKNVSSLLWE